MRTALRPLAAVLPLLLATALAGCDAALGTDAPPDAPSVQVLAPVVAPPVDVNVLLTNSSATRWSYNACASPRLQKREGDAWVDGPAPLIICTAELSTLGAGVARTVAYSAPDGLAVGEYRLRYRFLRADGVETFPVSNGFEVR